MLLNRGLISHSFLQLFRDFDYWLLKRGWLLNRASTVELKEPPSCLITYLLIVLYPTTWNLSDSCAWSALNFKLTLVKSFFLNIAGVWKHGWTSSKNANVPGWFNRKWCKIFARKEDLSRMCLQFLKLQVITKRLLLRNRLSNEGAPKSHMALRITRRA